MGALVRDARSRAGLTQAQLAQQVGVARLWVSQLESGKPGAGLGLVLRALNILGVDLMTAPSASSDAVRDDFASPNIIHQILRDTRTPYEG